MRTTVDADDAPVDATENVPSEPVRRASWPRVRALAALAALAVVVVGAIVYRWWLGLGPLGRTPNSDEAVVGLMGLHVLHGQFRAFYWNQVYGGSLEAFVVAPFVWLFGTSRLALRSGTTLLGIAAPVLTWRIARHLFTRRVALYAGVIAFWWPLTLVYFGTQERGFYPLSVALGLTTVLMAVNIDEQPRAARFWVVLGLTVGLGWWVSPNVVYYAGPTAVYLLARGHWREWRNILLAGAATGVGSAVWSYANLRSHFASLHADPRWAGPSTYGSRFGFFWQKGLPFALGLRRPYDGHWYFGPAAGRTVYGLALALLVVCLALALRGRPIDLLLVAATPFVYALFPQTWLLSEGRYSYFVASLLPLLLCRVLRFRAAQAAVLALVVSTGIMFARDYGRLSPPIAGNVLPIARAVEQAGYHTVVANYWIAFRIDYQTHERVIATPLPGESGVKYLPYVRAVQQSSPAYVFNLRGLYSNDRQLLAVLKKEGVGYRTVRAGAYYAVLPDRQVLTLP